MFKLITIRQKLLLLLMGYTAAAFILIILSAGYFRKKEEIKNVSDRIRKIELTVREAIKAQNDFLLHEAINPDFFRNKYSIYAEKYDSLITTVNREIKTLKRDELIANIEIENAWKQTEILNARCRGIFKKLVNILLIRGFQNYGLEGEMREYAHRLEVEFSEVIPAEDLLMLRRHEKDFIIRRDARYLDRFNLQAEQIKGKIIRNTQTIPSVQREAIALIDSYKAIFTQLVAAEKSIGLNETHGLKAEVDMHSKKLLSHLEIINLRVNKAQAGILAKLEIWFYVLLGVFMAISVIAAFILSRNMTRRLTALKKNLHDFVNSNFKEPSKHPVHTGSDEVGELARNFKVLEDEIVIHFNRYRNRVEKRTEEILTQKEEIEKTKVVIERKNKDILDSIKYAKKIQDSMLPDDRFIRQLLPYHFVLFEPKDIVSGDFYRAERKNNKVYLAVADCTGHGVPGAFMSIIGHNLLNQALHEKHIEQPELILNYLNVSISDTLGQTTGNQSTRIKDGMDISLVSIDFTQHVIEYAGAQRPLLIFRPETEFCDKETIIEIKGDRMPVGGYLFGQHLRFTGHRQTFYPGDTFYLFTDGYSDQFGGEFNKKFKYAKMRELLHSIYRDDLQQQRELLLEAHYLWRGKNEQVDDVCVIGVRL